MSKNIYDWFLRQKVALFHAQYILSSEWEENEVEFFVPVAACV